MRAWKPVSVPAVPPPKGAYSPAVLVGDLVFVSGQVPRDVRTGALLGDDIRAQSRGVLGNLRQVLEAAGGTLDDVVSATVYLADPDDWAAFNEVYRDTFTPPYPARAVVGAGLRGVLIEVSAIAVRSGAGGAP
ncbi:MAG: RidA family protein [Gemmatimonadaceae bacterium]